jgi:tRNA A-37 threonylcarbamoyl transferase component Bud32/tetratricopeptide (TPR) repeat protein
MTSTSGNHLRDDLQATLGSAYTVERELGGGGMSRVFLAEEARFGRKVVIKVLAPELAQGLSADRFEREIGLAATLQQANIVPLLTAGTTGELPYYTMPFVDGESLRNRLGSGQLAIPEVVSILRDVARALAYAHQRGVVHRDIKPDNVLLSGGAAVVTDFGIAKAVSASRTAAGNETLTQLGTAIGTPAYMAPEQAAGDPATDHRADIYAFGCVAFELLAGKPPFHGSAAHRLLMAHATEQAPSVDTLRPDTPRALAALIARCLEKEPERRPQSAAELLRALDATGPLERPTSVPRASAIRRAAIGVGVVGVLVAVFIALRAMGIISGGSLLAAGKLGPNATILVADFTVPGTDSTLGRVVAEAVKTTLAESHVVHVVPASVVTAGLQRMSRQGDTRLSLGVARELAQREGFSTVVAGDVAPIGSAYVLTVRLVDAVTGDVLASAQESAPDGNGLIPAIDRATRSLRGKIGESLRAVSAAAPLARVTTPSLEALRAYTAGDAANSRGDFQTAVTYMERAIALDTNFARAYSALSAMLMNLGAQPRRSDSLLLRAYALRDRASEIERLRIEMAYYRRGKTRDLTRALAAAESATVLEPAEWRWWNFLGILRRQRGDFARAETAYRHAIALAPTITLPHRGFALVLAQQRRWASLDSDLAALRASTGGEDFLSIRWQIDAAYLRGRLDSATMLAHRAAAAPRPDVVVTGQSSLRALALLHGRMSEAHEADVQLHAARAKLESNPPALVDSVDRALEDVWYRGGGPNAARRLTTALRAQPIERIPIDERPYLAIASAYALAGDAMSARQWIVRHDAEVKDRDLARSHGPARAHALAQVALLDHRPDEALRQIDSSSWDVYAGPVETQIASHASDLFWHGLVLAAGGNTDAAIASFEGFLAAPDVDRLTQLDDKYLPFSLERLGELYEAKGNAAKAIDAYARFAELWKNADAELQPRVAEVRRRIDRLRHRSG